MKRMSRERLALLPSVYQAETIFRAAKIPNFLKMRSRPMLASMKRRLSGHGDRYIYKVSRVLG